MSSENEGQCLSAQQVEKTRDAPKRSRISYSRDFLLSLSELEICKKLPSGFDESILSDFGEASNSIPEWPRAPGNLSSQSFRRGEYGSSPPTRGDSSYSRGTHGRWDSRSSGSNDKDMDSQSDKDSESGRRYGNQPRRPWQNPEHDGLLGSGAFPRPSGHAAGASVPKVRDAQYPLSRTNEPYHPPRPYKAVPQTRREVTDSFNDETFGSSETSSQDRAEEERKRRASFELFRKEHQNSSQEKKKQFLDKHDEHYDPDIAALLRDSEDKMLCKEKNGPDDLAPQASHSDTTKYSLPVQAPASRPLVPPGFKSSVSEKNVVAKSLAPCPASEIGNNGLEDNNSHIKGKLVGHVASDNQDNKAVTAVSREQQDDVKTVQIPFPGASGNMAKLSDVEVCDSLTGLVRPLSKASSLSEGYEPKRDYGVTNFSDEKVSEHEMMDTPGQKPSASILDRLFGGAITGNGGGSSVLLESNDVKADDTESQIPYQSSKFTHWFGEEPKPAEDFSSAKPKDLLSLIVSGDKSKSQMSEVSNEKTLEHMPSTSPFKRNEPAQRFVTSPAISATVGIHEPLYPHSNQDAGPGVLTCEDLEQSILSEINEKSSHVKHHVQPRKAANANTEQPKAEVNNFASQHILSLLQKGIGMKEVEPSPEFGEQSSNGRHSNEVGSISTVNNSSQVGPEVHNPENSLTLETFFGTSFMKELQSVQAPVSAQRGSVGGTTRTEFSGLHGFSFPVADSGLRPSNVGGFEPNRTTLEEDTLTSNLVKQSKANPADNLLLGFDVRRTEMGSKLNPSAGHQNRSDRAVEIQLPEEDSLIAVSDSMNSQNSMFMHVGDAPKAEMVSSSNASLDIVDKLAALNAAFKDERNMVPVPDGPSFLRGHYNSLEGEIPYQNMRSQPSSQPFAHLQQMNHHGRPLIQTLDSRMNPQMKFGSPENMIQHEPHHHHFPANVFRPPFQHSPRGPIRFEPPAQNHMLQHMHVPSQFLPPHLLQGHPRGAPLPAHPINHMTGYIPEQDPMHGFPLAHRQNSYSGLGMPMPAPGVGVSGSNHPEALGKLIEMELRANSKQIHPVVGAAHGSGAYSNEVDMGFRYR